MLAGILPMGGKPLLVVQWIVRSGRSYLHYRNPEQSGATSIYRAGENCLRLSGDRYGLIVPVRTTAASLGTALGKPIYLIDFTGLQPHRLYRLTAKHWMTTAHCDNFLTLPQLAELCNRHSSRHVVQQLCESTKSGRLPQGVLLLKRAVGLLKRRVGKRWTVPLTSSGCGYSNFATTPRSVRPLMKNWTARATRRRPMMRTRMRMPDSPMMPRTRLAPLRMR
jgi:hypothetical protein